MPVFVFTYKYKEKHFTVMWFAYTAYIHLYSEITNIRFNEQQGFESTKN